MSMTTAPPRSSPLAVTFGEPAGIGADITLFAWQARDALSLPPFYIHADPEALARRARLLGLSIPLAESRPETATEMFRQALPVVPLDMRATAQPGQPDDTSAAAAIASIRAAVDDVVSGRASAIVTNPVAKNVLYRSGFPHPGHTEFLGELAREKTGLPAQPVMMIWSKELAVVPVTIHQPLRDVADTLSTQMIVDIGRITARDLAQRFGIHKPRLAVAGLNPHAGEDGTIGGDDREVIVPAVRQLVAEGIDARGPFPADTMFHASARAEYDAALCMYHDQALIPAKTLAFDYAVNVTLGLPFVRTSPDHGTAFAVAGNGRAKPTSLIEALKLAARLSAQHTAPTLAPAS
jgi:4-hydroxythreonine-4-phosphate dehydrogenase